MKDDSKGILYASLTAALWGFLAIAIKVAVNGLGPLSVVWFRFASAFLLLAVATLIIKRSDFSIFKKPPLKLFLAALFLGLNYTGFITGLKFVSPASSQVFIMMGPVAFALSGIFVFREPVNWRHGVGFALVLLGMYLFYAQQMSVREGASEGYTKGMLLVIGAGLSWAVFASLQKDLVKRYNTNQLNLFIYSMAMLFLFPFADWQGIAQQGTADIILLIYLGVNTVLAYGALALAIKFTMATKVSVIITLNPIITFVSMAILGKMNVNWIEPEQFTTVSIVGALTVLAGAIVVITSRSTQK